MNLVQHELHPFIADSGDSAIIKVIRFAANISVVQRSDSLANIELNDSPGELQTSVMPPNDNKGHQGRLLVRSSENPEDYAFLIGPNGEGAKALVINKGQKLEMLSGPPHIRGVHSRTSSDTYVGVMEGVSSDEAAQTKKEIATMTRILLLRSLLK